MQSSGGATARSRAERPDPLVRHTLLCTAVAGYGLGIIDVKYTNEKGKIVGRPWYWREHFHMNNGYRYKMSMAPSRAVSMVSGYYLIYRAFQWAWSRG